MPKRVYGIIDLLSRHCDPTADGKRIPYALVFFQVIPV